MDLVWDQKCTCGWKNNSLIDNQRSTKYLVRAFQDRFVFKFLFNMKWFEYDMVQNQKAVNLHVNNKKARASTQKNCSTNEHPRTLAGHQ